MPTFSCVFRFGENPHMSGHCHEPEVLREKFSLLPVSRMIAKVQVGSAGYKGGLNQVLKVNNTEKSGSTSKI